MSEIAVPTTAIQRTRRGRWRATNMISSAAMNGAHVMIDSRGSDVIDTPITVGLSTFGFGLSRSCRDPLNPDDEDDHPEGHGVDVILCTTGLHRSHVVAGGERPRAGGVKDTIDNVAVDPANRSRQSQQNDAISELEDVIDPEAREGSATNG